VKRVVVVWGAALVLSSCSGHGRHASAVATPAAALVASVTTAAERIAESSARAPDAAWDRLTGLVDGYGNRITGSSARASALAWSAREMHADGLDDVHLEPPQVSHWVRRHERAQVLQPVHRPMALLGLGGTVGTNGILRARIVPFASLEELRASAVRLDGRIAFVNHRMSAYDEERDDPGYAQGMQAGTLKAR